jgi:fluoroquinolone transport system permease protein
MFKQIFIHELKNIRRDKMYAFFAIYSVVMIIAAYFLVPYLTENASEIAANLVTLVFILMISFLFGAVTGFTLLDDQDDNVLLSLRITPISVKKYIIIKLLISYVIGVISTFVLILVTTLPDIASPLDIVMITILAPMQAPIIALLINMLASNKVEGFVIMKMSGIILLAPIAVLFLTNWTEIFLMILPGFWPARLVSISLMPMDYLIKSSIVYFIIGLGVNTLIMILFFNIYKKRIHI